MNTLRRGCSCVPPVHAAGGGGHLDAVHRVRHQGPRQPRLQHSVVAVAVAGVGRGGVEAGDLAARAAARQVEAVDAVVVEAGAASPLQHQSPAPAPAPAPHRRDARRGGRGHVCAHGQLRAALALVLGREGLHPHLVAGGGLQAGQGVLHAGVLGGDGDHLV